MKPLRAFWCWGPPVETVDDCSDDTGSLVAATGVAEAAVLFARRVHAIQAFKILEVVVRDDMKKYWSALVTDQFVSDAPQEIMEFDGVA